MTQTANRLPTDFVLGAATASYQIEGAVAEDGRAPSMWDAFSHTPGKVEGGDTGDIACDHYHRLDADLDLMAELGLDSYRFSIAWPRVIPTGTGATNPAGLAFYDRLVDGLLARGITPMATLYHWDLPQVLAERGGWLNRDVAEWFGEYARVTVEALGDRVTSWITLNEPWCSAFLGYTVGIHAPGHTDPRSSLVAAHHLMLAHGTAVPIIRAAAPDASVGITLNPTTVLGPPDASDADTDAVRRVDNVCNRVFYGPLFEGGYPDDFVADTAYLGDRSYVHDGDVDIIAAPLDFLGINNYFPTRARAVTPADGDGDVLPGCYGFAVLDAPAPPLTAMGWETSPEAFRAVLERAAKVSGLPVYVTENGSAWDDIVSADGSVPDPERMAYLHSHLAALADAIEGGADIRGYYAWSLMDNFEWSWGYGKRFGIVHVDYATQKRTIKASGHEYARIIAEHRARRG